jgi:hypothetical protein
MVISSPEPEPSPETERAAGASLMVSSGEASRNSSPLCGRLFAGRKMSACFDQCRAVLSWRSEEIPEHLLQNKCLLYWKYGWDT